MVVYLSFQELPVRSITLLVFWLAPLRNPPAMEQVCKISDQARLARFVRNPTVQPQHRWAPAFPGGTADLHSAVLSGKINDVRGLLGAGADVMQTDRDGKTALTIARLRRQTEAAYYMASEHDELVRVLGKCLGRAPTQMEIYGVASLDKMRAFRQRVRNHINSMSLKLINAARVGDLMTVRRLLENGEIGPDVVDPATGETAFSAALAQHHRSVYIFLMESGVKMRGVCHIEGKRHSVLSVAVLTGDVSFVRRVLACGAPVVPADDTATDTCALVEAAKSGSIEMVQTLLDFGVCFDCTQGDLKLPKPFGNLFTRIRSALSTGTDAEPWLLLCAACWFDDQRLFKYLIQKYPQLQDQRAKPQYSSVGLVYAVFRQNEATVSELLERGASIASEGRYSGMFAAAMAQSARILKLLLQYSSDVSAIAFYAIEGSRLEDCVLSVAANLDARDCVTLLLPHETRPYYRIQALQWAIKRENFEIATQLLDAVRPISERDLRTCIWSTNSPVMLDLLLSRCCENGLSVSALDNEFYSHYRYRERPDLASVYIAHGFEITYEADGRNRVSHMLTDALRPWNGHPSPVKLQFVLANGVPPVSTTSAGITPQQDLAERRQHGDAEQAKLYDDCQALLATFS